MSINKNLQSYEAQFGEVDFKKGEDARSVHSPAAYLADLLQLLDDYFGNEDFKERRSDIEEIPLDAEHTFTLLPYLDIVNELLERKVSGSPYAVLEAEKYPLNIPFNLPDEKVKLFLQQFDVSRESIYKLFNLQPDSALIAKSYLGLSGDMLDVIVDSSFETETETETETDTEALKVLYGNKTINSLHDVAVFLETTNSKAEELLELLHPSLNFQDIELKFTNAGLNGYAKLNDNEDKLIWKPATGTRKTIPTAWFSRVNRLIRLSRQTRIPLTDLDLILRSCANNTLDKAAINTVAVIKQIASDYDLDIDVVCSFFSPINILGSNDDQPPPDLFNRIYNVGFAELDHQYFYVSNEIPATYIGIEFSQLQITGDIFSSSNTDARKRILNALHISQGDLQLLVARFDEKLPKILLEGGEEDSLGNDLLSRLSLYHRVSKLAQTMDISIQDLFNLLDLLQQDPLIRKYSGFDVLINNEIEELNGYTILARGTIEESMWLVQMLFALSKWMQQAQFSTAELKAILTGELASETEQLAAQQRITTGFNNLYQQFKPNRFTADYLVSDSIDQRTAKVIYDSLLSDGTGLVSSKNSSLLSANVTTAKQAIFTALNQLQLISPSDFKGLGIHEKVQDKIFSNLILTGFIKPDGTVIELVFPETPDDFAISHDFDSAAVFSLIQSIQQVQSDGSDDEDEIPEFPLFLTDLNDLELEDARKKELYDNLIFNGYIDEDGNVLQAAFFADVANQTAFDANTHLKSYAEDIYKLIQTKIGAFNSTPYTLGQSLFASLPLKDIEQVDLLENLIFNDYLDENQNVINKAELLNLKVDDFKLALMYYPHRQQILELIQGELQAFKSRYYTLSKDDFNAIAEQIVADDIYVHMETAYLLEDDKLSDANQLFFADLENAPAFEPGSYFDDNTALIVFKAIQRMVNTARKYHLNAESFTGLNLEAGDITELFQLMAEKNYINADRTLSPEQTTYFLNINNALDIKLEGFEDFTKDIFFVVHALAKEIDSTVSNLVEHIMDLAQLQEDVLFAGLQELFEIPADLVKVICRHVFNKAENMVELFIVPILAKLDDSDQITDLPDNQVFNIAYKRIQQFALLAAKLDINAVEADIIFRDQNLAGKYAEKLSLPEGVDHIDCLFQITIDGATFEELELEPDKLLDVILLYSAELQQSWLYDANDYDYLTTINNLSRIDPLLNNLAIDAAFNDKNGNAWIVSGHDFFCQIKGQITWEKKEKELGKVQSNFDAADSIDAAFVDQENKSYLFAGEQYVRSSDNLLSIDEGYPKKIEGNWKQELDLGLPESYNESIDATLQSPDEKLYFFKGERFIGSDDFLTEIDINQFWGKVKNNFAASDKKLDEIDAAFAHDNTIYFFAGDQCITWSYSLENENGFADEGSIQPLSNLIPNLPDEFEDGIDAIFRGFDNKIYLFKDEHSLRCALDFTIEEESSDLNRDWGKVSNRITHTGRVSAAFSGLDGNAYIFSGTQFFRYSGNSYTYVDEGYPKNIADNWGGLNTVDAAFILDGKTYLLGKNKSGKQTYLRYSSNDYSVQDTDYPKPVTANWWTDHFNLSSADFTADFTQPDTVFLGRGGVTYLFKDEYYIAYDKLHRWWSEPEMIKDKWAGFEFDNVDAAFTGKDGRTYLFAATKYLRYTDKLFNKLDDRYPKTTRSFWGNVKNNIQKNNRIDAALTLEAVETLTEHSQQLVQQLGQQVETTHRYTYLFSGNQFVRYSDDAYSMVDEGYPKTIVGSLKNESRFNNLDATAIKSLGTGIDAAFANHRNVYLFKDQQCTVVSATAYRRYENIAGPAISAVLQDEGKLYTQGEQNEIVTRNLESGSSWNTLRNLEGDHLSVPANVPNLLSEVPDEFQHDIDAAFVGTDKTLYVFKNGRCYNDALERSYDINEEWGRERNNVIVDNHIDAAFVGADGKTYLFSGDQYLSYTPEENSSLRPDYVDDHPKSISEDWGGLENVNIAFVRDDKTYLLEAPDEYGVFRYICYSSDDYSKPDNGPDSGPDGEPKSADISWWEFPSSYIEEGFDNVDAVLLEDEHLFLFNGNQFIQYNKEDDLWTYPRPVNRIWRGFPFDETSGDTITTVFTDTSGFTRFFSDSHETVYASQSFSPLEDINNSWGRARNTILHNNSVDAALVLDQYTYLFNGNQYVRYSTDDYRFIDDGCPKLIVENLRQEDGFTRLSDNFDERMTELLAPQDSENEGEGISGIVADERNLYIFETHHCHVVSRELTGQFPVSRLGTIKHNLLNNNRVDAAFVNQQDQTFLFSGDQYVRYSDSDYEFVDAGYPKSIAQDFANEAGGVAIPSIQGLDAALQLNDGKLYLFKGNQVYQSDAQGSVDLGQVIPAQQNSFSTPINAGFVAPDGMTYFFSNGEQGGQYIRYSDFENEYVDEGFPKAIKDNWGNLPANFEAAIDHAFVFEGKTYLVNGKDYVRYSSINYQMIDAIYPQTFTHRWGNKGTGWSDYLLSDLQIITAFKALLENNLSDSYSLSDLLNLELGYKKEPYKMLSEIFGWDINEVKWLKRKNAFYKNELAVEVNFNIELVLKMQDIFHVADALGTTPTSLYTEVYQNDFGKDNTEQVAETLYQWLSLIHSRKDWETLSAELHDKLNLIKHDALLPYVIADDNEVDNARDLFAKILIDVNMGSDARTSKIKEATAAIQLYFHRYFVNLETFDSPLEQREQLKQWWTWMRNYRVWEANRKVFLYPENYIRPELRDSKTPAFKKLEEALLQGEVTQDLVATAFHGYLNEFTAVGNLKITGANVFEDSRYPGDTSLVLFGHTRTEPGQYYYRTARFTATDTVLWDNWLPINISINSTRVFPVYAFGRILVFWTEIEAYEETKPLILTNNSTSKIETEDTVLRHRADIKYSFYDFNKQWVNPQTLKQGVKLEYKIDAAYADLENKKLFTFSGEYCLTTTIDNPQGEVKKIKQVYPDLHENFHTGIDAAVSYKDHEGENQILFFKGDQCVFNAGADPRPIAEVFPGRFKVEEYAIFAVLHWNNYLVSSNEDKQYQKGISAAFTVENKICLIDHQGLPVFFENIDGVFREEEITDLDKIIKAGIHQRPFSIINEFIKILTRNFLRLEPVDAVFEDENGILYVLRKGQYECYQYNKESFTQLEKIDGFPKPIKGNLSFNMDKFFNRLHVVETSEKGEDFISLTYASPEANAALLTGKVKEDFTFEEGDLWVDQYKQSLWDLSKTLSGSTSPSFAGSSALPADIRNFFGGVSTKLDDLIVAAGKPAEEQPVLTKYQQAIELVNDVVDAQEVLLLAVDDEDDTDGSALVDLNREDPEKVVVSNNDSVKFADLMTGESGVLPVLGELNLSAHRSDARAFNSAFSNFVSISNNGDWEGAFKILKNTLTDAESSLETLTETLATDIQINTLQHSFSTNEISNNGAISRFLLNRYGSYNNAYRNYLRLMQNQQGLPEDSETTFSEINTALNTYVTSINASSASDWISALDTIDDQTDIDAISAQLEITKTALGNFEKQLKQLQSQASSIETLMAGLPRSITEKANEQRELYYGRDDIFPADFGIENQANFTFSEPDWHIFEAKLGTFLCRPVEKIDPPPSSPDQPAFKYEIIRLTTRTIPKLSQALFSGGIDRLLTLNSQGIDEEPYFKPHPVVTRSLTSVDSRVDSIDGTPTDENTVFYHSAFIAKKPVDEGSGDRVPESKHLDYQGANNNYYWEIFFHAPFLIAQTLNGAQKFEEAKSWYEYIFDPTALNENWSFLPFKQAADSRVPLPDHLNRTLEVEDLKTEIQVYLNDPFDPHAIARIRQIAYQKSIVMRYVDNLLDWGDMLFRQYTMESINEARMLYVLAYDLLGNKPESLGNKVLPETRNYSDLKNPTADTDLLLTTEQENNEATELTIIEDGVHQSVRSPYFHIPENDLFIDYWDRVEDRLYKIRHSLNIEGVKQALPLFQPPIDPMSIVQAVAGGGSLSQIMAGSSAAIPHYRFNFMVYKARELIQKLNQFSGELLGAIEKRDAEQLSLLQNKQEAVILNMMTQVKEAQIEEAKQSIIALEASLDMVEANETYNQSTYDDDYIPGEIVQMSLMGAALGGHLVSAIARTVASFGGAAPDALVGPFIAGIKIGGAQAHAVAGSIAEIAQTGAEGFSVGGELAGIVSQHTRMMHDVLHQAESAEHDKKQIDAQKEGAELQLKIAEYELAIHKKEMEQHKSISTFMTGKFSNEQLYQWMSSKLSGLYYQSYKMAYDMAKAAEKSFQFERGIQASEVNYISGMYWNSQRKGLLAGDSLGLDLDRMEQAFIQTDKRRLEISKPISLLELDPLAFLRFKAKGDCEFELSEALFDYDFQGHYCRQIKTIAISFDAAEGQVVNATLTQLNNKTVMEADPKAVKYLLDPKDTQPLSIRSDWKASQQIALSHVDDYEKGNGLFELRYDDDRYLPFEGTGAVSRWRLELNGKRGSVNMAELLDATITIKYTALQGGEAFADTVRGLLKPYNTVRFFDLNFDFHQQWLEFLENDERSLTLNMTREHFPNIASSRITGIYSKFELAGAGQVSLILNNDDTMVLRDEQLLETAGLSVSNNGSAWTFTVQGNKAILKTVQLVVGYKAKV